MIYVFNDCEKNDWNMAPLEEGDAKSFSLNSGNQSLIKITEDSIEEPKEREEVFNLHRMINNIYKKNTYISYTKLGFVPSVFVSDRLLPVGRCNLICIQVDMSAGEKLINYSYFNFMIFKYKVDKANKCIRFIIGIREELGEGKFTLYFKSVDDKIIIRKTWKLSKETGKLSYFLSKSLIALNAPKGDKKHINTDDYRVNGELEIKTYLPKIVAANIIVPVTDDEFNEAELKEKVDKLIKAKDNKHNFTYHYAMCNGNENSDDIIMTVANNIYKYYNGRACTVVDFMHSYDDVNENVKQFIQKLDFVPSTTANRTAWKNALDVFDHVTVLLNDGKLLIYK